MKIPDVDQWRTSHPVSRQIHDDLVYGAILVIGIPALVIGGRFVINAIFALFM